MPSRLLQFRRRAVDYLATFVAASLSAVVVGALVAIFAYLVIKGGASVNWAFFTSTPKPVGEVGGGMANALVGSILILAIASVMGIPFGIGAGIYLAEYGHNRFGALVRFTADVLNGVPSIVIGLVGFALLVQQQRHFSALAGGVALAIMMVPTVARTTEEMLLLVPQAVREAAFGLGIPQWRTTISITLATARAGVITGIMLAFARIAGETAPLLFTALGNQFWSFSPNQPIAALPLQIYTYALSPYDDWHRQAWAGALVLVALIVGTIALVRFLFGRSVLKEIR
jgi:phosphate transport system permease protein